MPTGPNVFVHELRIMYGVTIGASTIQAMDFRRAACLAIEFSSRCMPYDPLAFGTSTLFDDLATGLLLGSAGEGEREKQLDTWHLET